MFRKQSICAGLLMFCLTTLMLAFPAWGQFLSGVEGTVHDSSGAAIPKAKVTLTDTRLNVTKTVITSDGGYFRIDSLAASAYSVQVTADGFDTYAQTGLTLQVGETRTLSPTLKIGSASAEVTVMATQAALNLSAATTGSIMTEETVSVTPLGGQNV